MGLCVHTIEDVVSWVDLAQLRHVFDWMATGRGGANAGLTGDATSLQSDTKKKSQNTQTKNQLKVNAELFSQMAPKESQSHP